MALESGTAGVWALTATNPPGSDDLSQIDDHMRMVKKAFKNTFPNVSATVSLSAGELNSRPAYGSMYFAGATTEFSASTSLDLFVGFVTPGAISMGTTIKTASGAIAVARAGHYDVMVGMSVSASSASILTVGLFVNDTDTGLRGSVLIPAQGRGSVTARGQVSMGVSDEIRVRLMQTVAKLITPKDGYLTLEKMN